MTGPRGDALKILSGCAKPIAERPKGESSLWRVSRRSKSANLNFGFCRQEIQGNSEQIFVVGAEGKGGTPPLPRREDKNLPEELEYQTEKPEVQVVSEDWQISYTLLSETPVI